jgi:hypothetical protein
MVKLDYFSELMDIEEISGMVSEKVKDNCKFGLFFVSYGFGGILRNDFRKRFIFQLDFSLVES